MATASYGFESDIERVATVLEQYAGRGVFRGFSRGPVRRNCATFRMLWHRGRLFELLVDTTRSTLRIPRVLPGIPAKSGMYGELRQFVDSRQSEKLPAHRRIRRNKARAGCGNRGGDVSLTLEMKDGDYEYAVRKLIALVHEIYMVFLLDGRYYEYLIEQFDLDPDKM